ncbi:MULTISPECIES: hypothetical protein [unclassified Microcoleus]|uniref:hypothetical protein n=1 Tax=unclassified Microcoleus TaxID=2642155 RepID=UPI002FD4280B
MPVPQENSSLVEQASCLLLTMVQDVSYDEVKPYMPIGDFRILAFSSFFLIF